MPATAPLTRLRRGVPVLPRGDGLLLVGTDPEHHVLLPDTPSVARLLVQLRVGIPPAGTRADDAATATVLAALTHAGLLVDAEEQAFLADARRATKVVVHSPGPWRSIVEECVRAAGLGVTTGAGDVTWVVAAGAPNWELHDALVGQDDPVLFTTVHPSRVCLGPFVLPGTTACLRCLAAQSHDVRPPRTAAREPVDLPEDLEPLLLRQALLRAVGDLTAWAEGRRPTTWSATSWMDGSATPGPVRTWEHHPHCGCGWDQSLTG
ncbi:hypothetical protein [Nocardioides daphniae]|uniref:TOMM leader peptide-binding protein n=1 Tax=Nocardioides daphniae TaxID=402297 RepID=A0A4P7UC77_9ACTN|nr:hypothetical protein [Nocardioides daphniae]QCC77802.1 hypothetical protein E2C04_12535 [Nocardioides daphniae]GGD28212.1 hypothetical protein GCM10007231_29660 [Nocardioides daphniae]